MRSHGGVIAMLGTLAAGCGVLAGGYLWVLTGSVLVGVASGFIVSAAASWLFHQLGQRSRRRRFVGEVRPQLGDEEFTCVDDGRSGTGTRVQQQVDRNPALAAGSIRQMMARDAGARRPRQR